jgi:protein CpxP
MSYLRNNKLLLLIIAVLIITNIVVLYFHVWRKQGIRHPSMKEMVMKKLEKEVGFSKQQLATYDSLRSKHYESMRPLFDELKSAKDNFFSLAGKPEVADSVINNYSTAVSIKQNAIDKKMLHYFWSLKNICTEDQKPKMDSFLTDITKRMAGGGRRGPGPEKDKK